jgi:hypothetical protein
MNSTNSVVDSSVFEFYDYEGARKNAEMLARIARSNPTPQRRSISPLMEEALVRAGQMRLKAALLYSNNMNQRSYLYR